MTWKANRLALRQGSLVPTLCQHGCRRGDHHAGVGGVCGAVSPAGNWVSPSASTSTNYLRVFADKDIWPMLSNSIVYAGGSALLGTGLGGLLGVDRRAHQYAGQRLGRVDAALSALDAADHEEHRLDSSAGAEVGDLKRHARTVSRDHLSGLQRLSAWPG